MSQTVQRPTVVERPPQTDGLWHLCPKHPLRDDQPCDASCTTAICGHRFNGGASDVDFATPDDCVVCFSMTEDAA